MERNNTQEQSNRRSGRLRKTAGALGAVVALGGGFVAGRESVNQTPVNSTEHTFELPQEADGENPKMSHSERIVVRVDDDNRFNFENEAGERVPVRIAGVEQTGELGDAISMDENGVVENYGGASIILEPRDENRP